MWFQNDNSASIGGRTVKCQDSDSTILILSKQAGLGGTSGSGQSTPTLLPGHHRAHTGTNKTASLKEFSTSFFSKVGCRNTASTHVTEDKK